MKNKSIRTYFHVLRESTISYFKEGAHFHAATISYYTLFSTIPLLYLIVVSFGKLFGEEFCIKAISDLIRNNVGLTNIDVFTGYIKSIHEQSRSWILNLVMVGALLYSCSAFMVSLKHSINEFFDVEHTKEERNVFLDLIKFRFLSLSYLALMALVIFLLYFLQLFVFSFVSSWFSSSNFGFIIIQQGFSLLLNYIIILFIFKFLQDGKVTWRLASTGAWLTSILLLLSQLLIKWYLQRYFFLGKGDIIGSVFILMAWVFYSAQVIFFGAKFTYIYGKNSR